MSQKIYQYRQELNWVNPQPQPQLLKSNKSNGNLPQYSSDQKKIQEQSRQIELLKVDKGNQQYIISPFKKEYTQMIINGIKAEKTKGFNEKIALQCIAQLRGIKSPLKMSFSNSIKSKNSKIMELQITFTFFVFKIFVLNLTSSDGLKINLQNKINQGAFGSVYLFRNNRNQLSAVKEISLGSDSQKVIQKVIKQYIIMKICSILQIGPSINKIYGFDLVTTQRNIYFSCQKGVSCYDFISYCQNQDQFNKQFNKLSEGLYFMHEISITHNDIKPDNIIYSPTLQKLVFIDFGLSQQNLQRVGYMKVQAAKGSLNYCSEQMRKIFFSQKGEGYVDMYYNDYISLQKTKQAIQNQVYSAKTKFVDKNKLDNEKNSKKDFQDFIPSSTVNDIRIQTENKRIKNYQQIQSKYVISEEMEDVHLINIVYLIYSLKQKQLKDLIQENPQIIDIININFKFIYFVFFEVDFSFNLFGIYKELIEALHSSQIVIKYETKQIIEKWTQAYFRVFIEKASYQLCTQILGKYFIQQKTARQSIEKRYLNRLSLIKNSKDYFKLDQNEKFQIKILTIDLQDNFKQSVRAIHLHILQFIQPQLLIISIAEVIDSFGSFPKWFDIANEKFIFLQSMFIKLGLKIVVLSSSKQLHTFQKFIIHVRLLINVYFQLIDKFRIDKAICYYANYVFQRLGKDCNQVLYAILSLYLRFQQKSQIQPIPSFNQNTEENKEKSKQQFQFKINREKTVYFSLAQMQFLYLKIQNFVQSFESVNFELFQQILTVIDKLKNIFYQSGLYKQSFDINQRFLILLEKLINQTLLCKCCLELNRSSTESPLASIENLCDQILVKCLEHRYIAMKQTLSNLQQSTDIFQFYQYSERYLKLRGIIGFKGEYFETESQIQKAFQNITTINNRIFIQYFHNSLIQEEFYKLILCSLIIPESAHRKFRITDRFQQIFQKLKTVNTNMEGAITIKNYSLSKILKCFISQQKITKSIQLLRYFDVQQYHIYQENLYFMSFNFFSRIHNSKQIKKIKQKIQCFKWDNLTVFDSTRGLESQILNLKEMSFQNKNIQKNYTNSSRKQILFKSKAESSLFNEMMPFEIQKCWSSVSTKEAAQTRIGYKLKEYRQIIKSILYSPFYSQNLLKTYLEKYSIQQSSSMAKIKDIFYWLRQNKKLMFQIPQYLGFESMKNQFWINAQRQTIFLTKIRLIQDLVRFFSNNQQRDISIVSILWQSLSKLINQLYQNDQQKLPILFFEIQCRFKQASYFNKFSSIQKNIRKIDYQVSIVKYLKKIQSLNVIQSQAYESTFRNVINGNKMNNTVLKNKKLKQIQLDRTHETQYSLNEEMYINILMHIYVKNISIPENIIFLQIFQQNKSQNIQLKVQSQLKQLFYVMGKKDLINIVFTYNIIYVRWLWIILKLAVLDLINNKKRTQVDFDNQLVQNSEISHQPHYFLTYILQKLLVFVSYQRCSSYSCFMLNVFKQIREQIIDQLQNSNFHFNKKIAIVNQFEEEIFQNIVHFNKKERFRQGLVILMNCEQIKWFHILYHFLCQQKNSSAHLNKFEIDIQQCVKHSSTIFKKICLQIRKQEQLIKQFLQIEIYNFLILFSQLRQKTNLAQLQRLFQVHQQNLILSKTYNLLQKTSKIQQKKIQILRKKVRYYQIKYLRFCRKYQIDEIVQKKKAKIYDFDKYYESFQPLKYKQLIKIISNRQKWELKYEETTGLHMRNKIKQEFMFKLDKLLKIII